MARDLALTQTAGSRLPRWRIAAQAAVPPLFLAIAGLSVYANSLDGVFVFDDTEQIVENFAIRQWWPPARPGPRFLLYTSLAMNYALGGLDPAGYHVFNIAVHLGAGLALFGLVRRTLRLPSLGNHFARSADGMALAVALVWVVHPLQTQAVTYIVQRCEAMMGLFFLLTLYSYVRGATAMRPWARRSWYATSFLTYCLGLLSKEVMVTVLPVLWLYDRLFLAASWREIVRQRGWLYLAFAVLLAAALVMLIPAVFAGANSTAGFGIQAVTPWEYARSQPGVILHYLRLSVWPYPQCLDYGWPIETRWLVGIALPGLAVLGLLATSVVAMLRGRRIGFLGIAFFLILAPTSSIVPIQDLCFEHRMYLPLACVVTACVLAGHAVFQRLPWPSARTCSVAVLLAVVLVLGSLTVVRNRVYHSAVAMWMDVIQKTRHHRAADNLGRALNNLGDELLDAGRVEEGVEVLRQAVKLNPDMAQIHGNLGRGLTDLQDFAGAQHSCDEAVRLDPKGARFRQQLGLLAAAQGRLDGAEAHLRQALALAPSDSLIETNLAKCLADQQQLDEAINRLQDVVRRDPKFTEARQRLATVLATAGRYQEAAAQARDLASRSPQDARPCLLLGLIELQQPDQEAALRWFAEALQRDPRCAAAHLHSGNIQRRRGEQAEAVRCYEKAVAIDEELAEAQNNLGGLLAQDEPRRASRHFQAAVKARPDFLEARFNLAATMARLGVADQAAEQYRAVLQIQPDFAPARAGLEALAAGAKPP